MTIQALGWRSGGRYLPLQDDISSVAFWYQTEPHVKYPELPRPFKIPFSPRIRGREIPLTAVIGLLGTSGTWLVVAITQEFGRNVGVPWLVLGTLGYWLYRRSQGLPFIGWSEDSALTPVSPAQSSDPQSRQ